MSEIETDKVKGCKRERERQDGGERKRRDEEQKKKERRSCPDGMYGVCMYGIGMYWYGMGRYGTAVVWYGLFLFVLNRYSIYGGWFLLYYDFMISLLAKSTSHFAPQEVTQPSYL